jgi:hypothetical protein
MMMKMNSSQIKNYDEMARQEVQTMSNQKAIAAISSAWSSIFANLGNTVFPVISDILVFIAGVTKLISDYIGFINDGAASLSPKLGTVVKWFTGIASLILLIVGAKGIGKLVGWASGGIGKGIGSVFGNIADGVGKFGGANVMKGALGITLLGVSMFIFAKALNTFAGVKWSDVFIGIGALVLLGTVAGIIGALSEFIIPGAIAIGLLGLALIPFAAATWITSKALQNLSDVPLLAIAGGLFALGLVSPAIIAGGLALGLASPGFIAFSIALRLIAGPVERAGQAMKNLGEGLKLTVDSLVELNTLSFVNTITQIKSLSSVIIELSKAIGDMPEIKVEKLKSLVIPSADKTGGDGGIVKKGESTGDVLSAIKDGIEGIRNDFKKGAITANVFLDSQRLDAQMGRRLAYTGPLV